MKFTFEQDIEETKEMEQTSREAVSGILQVLTTAIKEIGGPLVAATEKRSEEGRADMRAEKLVEAVLSIDSKMDKRATNLESSVMNEILETRKESREALKAVHSLVEEIRMLRAQAAPVVKGEESK